jgi:hypothetical protein
MELCFIIMHTPCANPAKSAEYSGSLPYWAAGAYPGGMHRMHVHPPFPPCASPLPVHSPPPQPERLVMRGGGVGQPKMCIPPRQNPTYAPVGQLTSSKVRYN